MNNKIQIRQHRSHVECTLGFQLKLLLLGPDVMIVLCEQLCHGLQVKAKRRKIRG